MKKTLGTLIFLSAICLNAFGTWSIIVVDPKTKEIGIAGASCTSNCFGIGSIIPGRGAIIVQAMSNANARDMGRRAIIAGHPIEGILEALRQARFDPEHQQYALVTLDQLYPVTYTGDSTIFYKGSLTAKGISVQGNILSSDKVLKAVFEAAIQAQKESLSVQEILMKALEAGEDAGGDKRCGEQRAQSAFMQVARPGDNPENPYLSLVIKDQPKGEREEKAVVLLRRAYEKWSKEHAAEK